MKHISSLINASFSSVAQTLAEQGLITSSAAIIPSTAIEKLGTYVELLESWTKKLDLVGPGGLEILIERHLRDGFAAWLLLAQSGVFQSGATMDVGSGAGLPGVVFATLSPASSFVLCEPREKRVVFLQEVKRRLELKDCIIVKKRVEELHAEDVRGVGAYVFRALTPTGSFMEHFRKINPLSREVVFITGAQSTDQLGIAWSRHEHYLLAGDSRGRTISYAKIGN